MLYTHVRSIIIILDDCLQDTRVRCRRKYTAVVLLQTYTHNAAARKYLYMHIQYIACTNKGISKMS